MQNYSAFRPSYDRQEAYSGYPPFYQVQGNVSGKEGSKSKKETRNCFCDIPGHLQKNCFKRKREMAEKSGQNHQSINTTSAAIDSENDMTVDIYLQKMKVRALIDTGSHIYL